MGICEISNDFERSFPQSPKVLVDGKWVDDYVDEDTQLCYRHSNGEECSVVAACAHYGICNIMEYAKKLTGASASTPTWAARICARTRCPSARWISPATTCAVKRSSNFTSATIPTCPRHSARQRLPAMEAGVGLVVECE